MINVNGLMKVKSNFPVMVGKGIISKKDCDKLINEIKNANAFDDLIQGGRNRINKGSLRVLTISSGRSLANFGGTPANSEIPVTTLETTPTESTTVVPTTFDATFDDPLICPIFLFPTSFSQNYLT